MFRQFFPFENVQKAASNEKKLYQGFVTQCENISLKTKYQRYIIKMALITQYYSLKLIYL